MRKDGGDGIRTHGAGRPPALKAGALVHSATPPGLKIIAAGD